LTAEGGEHPVTRIGHSRDETAKLWSALPPLAASAPLGAARPGATVLATITAPSGGTYPLVAVQRYGRGRSMVFAGEGAWRWKMLMPSDNRSYEYFWRQSLRWLSASAGDPVSIVVPDGSEPGDSIEIAVEARDSAYVPVEDATVEATVTEPGSEPRALTFRRSAGRDGRFAAAFRPSQAGLYRIHAEAKRGTQSLGTADRSFLVGGSEREFSEPRLNEGVLRRVARATGGRYLRAGEASQIVSTLQTAVPQNAAPSQRDLWHEPWAYAFVLSVLTAEWVLRRRWGLR
jgi:hypothetical protein